LFSFFLVDFGVDELMEFSAATNCPWLLSNVIDNVTEKQLADGEIKQIIEWGERKVGCSLIYKVKTPYCHLLRLGHL